MAIESVDRSSYIQLSEIGKYLDNFYGLGDIKVLVYWGV